ncbi:Uma2 family endonuclease [Actinoplanes sp. NPDC024001]|uniref:Uma2 family endonuclease n=1 Tax=Actinoplanes sp. NPDC024001 TaxID=3154598 RepID=UPI0033E5AC4F
MDSAAGPDWNADTDFDVRLQDVPLNNRRPDVTVYRADTIDVTPTRPEHVLLVVEVVSPGSETTDRIVKADQYARAGIQFYWRRLAAVAQDAELAFDGFGVGEVGEGTDAGSRTAYSKP